ncbi:MAG: tetratricopeptide repeat protein, partial [Bacteroidales bacterium]
SYAEFLRKQGRFDEAIEHYKKAIDYSPGFLASHKGLADSYLFKGEYGLAREQYRNYYKRLSGNYSKFNALFLEASVDLHENNLEAAMKTMDKYTDLAEELDLPFYKVSGEIYKGYILCERGKTEDGWKHYSKAIYMMKEVGLGENTNENTENLSHLVEFSGLTSNGDLAKAENARQKCEKRLTKSGKPDDWQRYYRMWGILEMKKGNYRQARKYLAKAYEHPMKWYYMGLVWEKSGNQRKARKWYEKVANHYDNSIDLGIFRNKALAGLKE